MKLTIINTGGTFNKIYNPISGLLEVRKDSFLLDDVLQILYNVELEVKNIISKDSLDMTDNDREILVNCIEKSGENIIIIHGTDTIDISANFIYQKVKNKKIILTGAMIPMSIDKVDGLVNFASAIGFLNADIKDGVYISMHGSVVEFNKIKKDKNKGKFLNI